MDIDTIAAILTAFANHMMRFTRPALIFGFAGRPLNNRIHIHSGPYRLDIGKGKIRKLLLRL